MAGADIIHDFQIFPITHLFQDQIMLQTFQLPVDGNEAGIIQYLQIDPQVLGEFVNGMLRPADRHIAEGIDRIQDVEHEMGLDLADHQLDPGLLKPLFLFLQAVVKIPVKVIIQDQGRKHHQHLQIRQMRIQGAQQGSQQG